jgi:hypothetical protein
MTKFVVALVFCVLTLACGCGQTGESGLGGEASDRASATNAASVTSPEIHAMAVQLLGRGTEVLVSGDLAGNGRRQVLVINRSSGKPSSASAVVFSRAAVLEQRGSKWSEVLLCDEYLKNAKGFLIGTPLSQVTAWRLQFTSHSRDGKAEEFDFTPLQQDGMGHLPTIIVRWNPGADRYQSFDPEAGRFLDEVMSLEPPRSELR